MNEQAVRFRLGIFVLSSLIVLAVLIVLFGGRPTLFQASDKYTITFDNAPGVEPGTPVRRSGVKIGDVERVELDNDTGKVIIGIRVDKKYSLRKGDRAVLRQGLLGGDSVIDFIAPEPGAVVDNTPLEPGALIPGQTQMDTGELVQQAGKVVQPAEESAKEMAKVLKKLDKMMPEIEATVKEFRDVAKATNELVPAVKETNKELQALTKSVQKTVPEVNKTLDEVQLAARNWSKVGERTDILLQTNEKKIVKALEDLSKTLEEMSKIFTADNREALNEILKNTSAASKDLGAIAKNTDLLLKDSLKTINKFSDTIGKADKVLDNLDKVTTPMAERSEKILKNLDEATAQLNTAMGEIRVFLQAVSKSEGTVYKLLNDPVLYNRLNEAAYMANKVFPRLDRILEDIETFADKIARHPELLGVSGAIRPSSGLKDLPPYPTVFPSYAPAQHYQTFPPSWKAQ